MHNRRAIVALAAVAALSLTGCGADAAPEPSGASVSPGSAETSTSEETSASADAAFSLEGLEVGDTVPVDDLRQHIDAAVAMASSGRVTVETDTGPMVVDLDLRNAEVRLRTDLEGTTILDGDTLYMPATDGEIAWTSYDMSKAEESDDLGLTMAAVLGKLVQTAGDIPALIAALDGDSAEVTAVEGGVTTFIADLKFQEESTAVAMSTVSTWVVDREGLPQSVEIEQTDGSLVLRLSDWGAVNAVKLPPPNRTTAYVPGSLSLDG